MKRPSLSSCWIATLALCLASLSACDHPVEKPNTAIQPNVSSTSAETPSPAKATTLKTASPAPPAASVPPPPTLSPSLGPSLSSAGWRGAKHGARSPRLIPRATSLRDYVRSVDDPTPKGVKRERKAFDDKEAEVKALFQDAGVPFPPAELLLVSYKKEAELEVWANARRGARLTRVARYKICAASGEPGPKRQEGDYQVPEGFYVLDLYYNRSAYFLSMRINYPNRSDAVLGKRPLGDAIMIHGSCASIGCLAMTDERIKELWVMARSMDKKKRKVPVYLFPQRDLDTLIDATPEGDERLGFWKNVREGKALFDATHRRLQVSVDRRSGAYRFK